MNNTNKEENKSFIKYIISIRRSKFTYILLLLAIIPRVIWMTKDIIPESSFLEFNIKPNFDNFINNLDFIKSSLINLWLALPNTTKWKA